MIKLEPPRAWRNAVVDALERRARNDGTVDRQSLIGLELRQIVLETRSRGRTPEQTLSRVLQDLREDGVLDFVGPGAYRLRHATVDLESADLTDSELDDAILSRMLKIGRVATDNVAAMARLRRGQARLRQLTLQNYDSYCALCDVNDATLLVASHVLPWALGPDARGDLRNILCLCAFHDSLFEVGYWSMTDDYEILRRRSISSSSIRALLPDGTRFRPPHAFPPDPAYLKLHRERHGF